MRIALIVILALLSACTRGDAERAEQQRRRAVVVAEMRERQVHFMQTRQRVDTMRMEQAKVSAALPAEADLPALFASLHELADLHSIELIEWRVGNAILLGDLVEIPIDLEMRGSFAPLVGWLDGALDGRRVITVDEIKIGDRRVQGKQVLSTATMRLMVFRKGEAAPTDPVPGHELDKEFAGDPEIRRLYEQTKDLELIEAALDDLEARKARLGELLGRGNPEVALLELLRDGKSSVWLEGVEIHRGTFTIDGGAAESADVVEFMKLLQASRTVADLVLESEGEATDPATKLPMREFKVTGKIGAP